MKILVLALIFNSIAIIPYASSQSEGTSVASPEHDPLSVSFNHAHLGLATLNRSFQFEFLNLLEFISLRRGRNEDNAGRVFYDTDGFGLRSAGFFKIAFIVNPQLKSNSILLFLRHHFDVQYNTSKFNASPGHPLDGIKFKGVRVSFF